MRHGETRQARIEFANQHTLKSIVYIVFGYLFAHREETGHLGGADSARAHHKRNRVRVWSAHLE